MSEDTINKVQQFNDLQAQLAAIQAKVAALAEDPTVKKTNAELSAFQEFVKGHGYASVEAFCVSHGYVRKVVEETKGKRTKKTPELVAAMVADRKAEMSYGDIAKKHGCTTATATDWIKTAMGEAPAPKAKGKK